MALQALLSSAHFLFRIEETPALVTPGVPYRISDVDLASRLSFFLWGTLPDAALITAAGRGELTRVESLERQVRRMLIDDRAAALGGRFAAQWLRLQDLHKVEPDALSFPYYDEALADAMARETELLFEHLVREDRPALELLTADYTFVNERLARHYGIRGVSGPAFRKVQYPDDTRRGLLGHGSVLTLTSHGNRTSPVLRGKWVMEVLLGTPPPPPPPAPPPSAPPRTQPPAEAAAPPEEAAATAPEPEPSAPEPASAAPQPSTPEPASKPASADGGDGAPPAGRAQSRVTSTSGPGKAKRRSRPRKKHGRR
jgi:hypothetical protein